MTAVPMGRDSYMPCAHATSPTIQRLKDTPAAPPKNQPTLPLNRGQSRPERECSFMVLYEPAEEGGYVVTCPALPGLVTEGETLEEAIRAYLESLKRDGMPIPTDKKLALDPVRRSSESRSQPDGPAASRFCPFCSNSFAQPPQSILSCPLTLRRMTTSDPLTIQELTAK